MAKLSAGGRAELYRVEKVDLMGTRTTLALMSDMVVLRKVTWSDHTTGWKKEGKRVK